MAFEIITLGNTFLFYFLFCEHHYGDTLILFLGIFFGYFFIFIGKIFIAIICPLYLQYICYYFKNFSAHRMGGIYWELEGHLKSEVGHLLIALYSVNPSSALYCHYCFGNTKLVSLHHGEITRLYCILHRI